MPNIGPLSEVCQPVVVEQYGHGQAATVDDPERLSASAYGLAFDQIRRDLGAQTWFVVGHSLGGALTIRYAIEHADHVLGHVFTNSQSAFADDEWVSATMAQSRELAARLEGPDGRAVLDQHPMHPRRAGRISTEVSAALVADFASHDPAGVAGQMRYTLPTASVRSIAQRNDRPALLTVGTGEVAFADTASTVMATMPRVESVDFDAGHNVNLHQPVAWNAAVREFFVRNSVSP
jgi:pimeloyl-ACP methyl ester carboxylesterase